MSTEFTGEYDRRLLLPVLQIGHYYKDPEGLSHNVYNIKYQKNNINWDELLTTHLMCIYRGLPEYILPLCCGVALLGTLLFQYYHKVFSILHSNHYCLDILFTQVLNTVILDSTIE